MDTLVVIAVITMVISKFLDCLSTHLNIRNIGDEENLIGKTIMNATSLKGGIWLVFLLSILIIGITTWLLYVFYPSHYYKVIFVIAALFISLIQFAVAHHNFTGRLNFITRQLRKLPLYNIRKFKIYT